VVSFVSAGPKIKKKVPFFSLVVIVAMQNGVS
jgi:hypothetical protein